MNFFFFKLLKQEVNKVALCSDDDKRYTGILENRVNTLAWGHHKIPQDAHIGI